MYRKLFNLAAAVSLVLSVAAAALWVSTCFMTFQIGRISYSREADGALRRDVVFMASNGLLQAQVRRSRARSGDVSDTKWWGNAVSLRIVRLISFDDSLATRLGFQTFRESNPYGESVDARVPLWSVVVIALVLPLHRATWIVRRRRRAAAGLCPTCGYDCRGPAVGTSLPRCPECGTDLPLPATATPPPPA